MNFEFSNEQCALKAKVAAFGREVLQDREAAASDDRELDGALAEAGLERVQVDVEQRPRVADDDERIRLHGLAPVGPVVVRIIERGREALRAHADLPRDGGGEHECRRNIHHPAPRERGDFSFKTGSR